MLARKLVTSSFQSGALAPEAAGANAPVLNYKDEGLPPGPV